MKRSEMIKEIQAIVIDVVDADQPICADKCSRILIRLEQAGLRPPLLPTAKFHGPFEGYEPEESADE